MTQNIPNQNGNFPNNSSQPPSPNNPNNSFKPGTPGGQGHQMQPYQPGNQAHPYPPQPGNQSPMPPAPIGGNYQWNNYGQPQGQSFPGQPAPGNYQQYPPFPGQPVPGMASPMPNQAAQQYPDQKSKLVAGLLGIFLGALGVHNFYLGNTGKAVAQLLMSLLSLGFLAGISAIWGLIEGIVILAAKPGSPWAVDARGIPLSS